MTRIGLSNPVVEVALEHLIEMVNVTMGASHPSDRSATIHLFKILKQEGESFDPEEVREWLVSHGWPPRAAKDIQKIAENVLAGKRMKRGTIEPWSRESLESWRREAQAKANRH